MCVIACSYNVITIAEGTFHFQKEPRLATGHCDRLSYTSISLVTRLDRGIQAKERKHLYIKEINLYMHPDPVLCSFSSRESQ